MSISEWCQWGVIVCLMVIAWMQRKDIEFIEKQLHDARKAIKKMLKDPFK